MGSAKATKKLDHLRRSIAAKVRALRTERAATQRELAEQLGMTQGRLSEIERGDGSFTAEQLLVLLRVFNVPVSHFAPPARDTGATLQNALVRLGAAHLQAVADVTPSERLEEVGAVVREVLLAPSPRQVTALGPVLVLHVDPVMLRRLHAELAAIGLDHRLGWLLDNVLEAVRRLESLPRGRPLAKRCRRAEAVLDTFLEHARPLGAVAAPADLLDLTIASAKTRAEAAQASSAISKRWGIVTDIQPDDFVEALRDADARA
jgi:transcriptional regulator with XRE-family HTH domain